MKWIQSAALTLFLSFASLATAQTLNDYSFQQERMFCGEDGIYIISNFEESDAVTAYSYSGTKLWNRSFYAMITSWQVVGNYIIVFSKHRGGYQTYLTCLNRFSGEIVWQKP